MMTEKAQGWQLRRAQPEDIARLVEMRVALLFEMGLAEAEQEAGSRQLAEAFWREKLPTDEIAVWVIEGEGRVVGMGGVMLRPRIPLLRNPVGVEGYVMNMYTEPAWRGQGCARAILEAILAYLRQHNVPEATLYASDEGRPLYVKYGFQPAAKEMRLWLTAAD
jgi:GNAT superfamily N-acetyltransferase